MTRSPRAKGSLVARLAIAACLAAALPAAGFAVRYTRELSEGKPQASIRPFSSPTPAFERFVAQLRATLPPDARLLLEPVELDQSGAHPMARWHLYLNYELPPIRAYTRAPAMASGTLVDYPRWLQRHFSAMRIEQLEGQRPRALEGASAAELAAADERAIAERGIDWRLRYLQHGDGLANARAIAGAELARRTPTGWERVELAAAAAPEPRGPPAWVGALAAALALFLGGQAALFLLRRFAGAPARGAVECAATSLGLGLALGPALALGWAWLAGGPITVGVARGLLAGLALVGAPCLVANLRSAAAPPAAPQDGPRWLVVLGALAAALFAAFALYAAAALPAHGFDALFHFAYKGKLLATEGLGSAGWTDLDGPVGRIATHPGYPAGIGALGVLASALSGPFDADAARCLMPLFLLVGAGWLWAALRERSRLAALAAALLWLSLPIAHFLWNAKIVSVSRLLEPLFGAGGPGAARGLPAPSPLLDGSGDLPLAALLVGAALHLRRALLHGPGSGPSDAILAGALLGGAALVKNEGLAMAAVLAIATLAAALVRSRAAAGGARPMRAALAAVATALAVAALVALPWYAGHGPIPAIDEDYPALLTWEHLSRSVVRWREIVLAYGSSFASVARWDLIWPLWAISVAWIAFRALSRRAHLVHPAHSERAADLVPALAVLGGLSVYFAVLVVTPWNLDLLFNTLIPDRLLVHLAPLAIWSACAAAWPPSEAA